MPIQQDVRYAWASHKKLTKHIGDSRQLGTASSMKFEWILSLSGNLVSDRQI